MRKIAEKGKCNSCGDYSELYDYNRAKTCGSCLSMDRRGVSRPEILTRNTGEKHEIRRTREKRW